MTGTLLVRNTSRGQWWQFADPLEVVTAYEIGEVLPALLRIEAEVEQQGRYAAGFISYEAAPAFDRVLQVRTDSGFPLLWFGLYREPRALTALPLPTQPDVLPREWSPSLTLPAYTAAIDCIKDHIARGDTYQVNYTLRLHAPFDGDPLELFLALARAQPVNYAAYVDTGRYVLCSASPELFFQRAGRTVTSRPMKGTAPRGRYTAEDAARAEWLRQSAKNRAENVMIVDMVRNDLGRVAEVGSVQTPSLFDVERYPTVWQMTSTVTAETEATTVELLTALFPCASITGAPKASTMRLIAELETAPRRSYTGCIGWLAPGRQAQFNVAIRTVLVDRERGCAEYGVGGGIVWDSQAQDEYAECQHKARVLTEPRPTFDLFETLRWSPGDGYYLLNRHLARLADSAAFFDFAFDPRRALDSLETHARRFPNAGQRVRLVLARDGTLTVQATLLDAAPAQPVRLQLARHPVQSSDPLLFHKTTQRQVYDAARAACPAAEDVILWNERAEITETTLANLAVQFGDEWVTPPLDCGLLPGTLRAELLETGQLVERVILREELAQARALARLNSVRGWQEAVLIDVGV